MDAASAASPTGSQEDAERERQRNSKPASCTACAASANPFSSGPRHMVASLLSEPLFLCIALVVATVAGQKGFFEA